MRTGRWLWVGLGLVSFCFACDDGGRPPLAMGRISGQVFFEAAVVGAQVELVPATTDGAALGGPIATTETDAAGGFVFEGLRADTETMIVRAHLAGTPRPNGAYGALTLRALVTEHRPHAIRPTPVAITPWSSLLLAAADARRAAGWTSPVGSARAAMAAHLGLDALDTPVAADAGAPLDDPRRHRLLLDGLERLADRIADAAGVPRGATITAVELLDALLADARGGPEPGRLDGLGADGPVVVRGSAAYALSGQTLRGELADAVASLLDDTPDWTALQPAAIQDLLARLRCATAPASDLFPACVEQPTCDDVTGPMIGAFEPADGETIGGVVELFVPVSDPESGVETVEAVRLAPEATLPERPARPRYTFELDTTALSGTDRVQVRVAASNRCGVRAERAATYRLRNRGAASLEGVVIKGPARAVTVQVHQLVGLTATRIAEGTTDAAGAFQIEVPETQGALLVRAVAAAAGGSAHHDEARGWMAWGDRGTLSAVVPDFDSGAEAATRVTVSPFTDLAWVVAEQRGRAGAAAPLQVYRETLTALGEHLGLVAPFDALQTGRPLDFAAPSPDRSLTDGARVMLGLACLAQQALDLASATFPDNPDLFTALDLVALYRADLADGYLDGWTASGAAISVDIEGQRVTLPADPARGGLAEACVRWLGGDHNQTGYDRADAQLWLEHLATGAGPLFNPEQAPRPLDIAGPELAISLHATDDGLLDDGALGRVEGGELLDPAGAIQGADGTIEVRVEAEDASGVVRATLRLEAGLPQGALVVQSEGPVGEGTAGRYRLSAALRTADLPEGVARLTAETQDRLGNTTRRTVAVRVDRAPPRLEVRRPAGVVLGAGGWLTNRAEAHAVPADIEDASPVTLAAAVDGTDLGELVVGEPVPLRVDAWAGDGTHTLSVTARDSLGHAAVFEVPVTLDTAAPAWALRAEAFADERALPPTGEVAGVPQQQLALNERLDLARWQTHWGADAPNPVSAVIEVSDRGGACAGCQVRYRRCVGADACVDGVGGLEPVDGGYRLDLWSDPNGPEGVGNLGFDPWDAPLAPGTTVDLSLTFTDAAGNTSAPLVLRLAIEVLPPPLVFSRSVEVPLARRYIDVTEIGFDSVQLRRAVDEDLPVRLTGIAIENPHGSPILFDTSSLPRSLSIRTSHEMQVIASDAMIGLLRPFFEPPECARTPDDLFAVDDCGVCALPRNGGNLTGCVCGESVCVGTEDLLHEVDLDQPCHLTIGSEGEALPLMLQPGETRVVDLSCDMQILDNPVFVFSDQQRYASEGVEYYRPCRAGGGFFECVTHGPWIRDTLSERLVRLEATLDDTPLTFRQTVGDVHYDRSDVPQPEGFLIERPAD